MINIPAVKLFNGVEMPTEGFGVFQISETECKNIVLDAIHTGYRLIDTASSYKNEQAVGDAVKQAIDECIVSRDELFITTKAYIQEMGYDNLKWAFERSLKILVSNILICILFICRSGITTERGELWKNYMNKAG